MNFNESVKRDINIISYNVKQPKMGGKRETGFSIWKRDICYSA